MRRFPGVPQRIGVREKILAVLLLLGSIAALLAGLVLAAGNPYHDTRFPFLLLYCLAFVVWGLGFGYVASRMLITQRAKVVSGTTIGVILVTPLLIYYALLVTKGEWLEGLLGLLVVAVACAGYWYNNRRTRRTR